MNKKIIFLALSTAAVLACAGNPHFTGGKNYVKQQVWDKAASEFELATEADPGNAEAWWYLGWSYCETAKYGEAAGAFDKAIELDETYAPKSNDKIQHFWEQLGAKGQQLKDGGNYEGAREVFRDAIALKPDTVVVYLFAAEIDDQLGLVDDAIAKYEKAVELDPGNEIAMRNYPKFLERNSRLDEAIPLYESLAATAEGEEKKNIQGYICQLYNKVGDKEKAINCYRELGDAVPILNEASEAYNEDRFVDAADLYEMARSISESGSDDYFHAWYNQMVSYYKAEDWGTAIEVGEALTKERDSDPKFWTLLGNCYAKVKRGEDSLKAHKRAQDLQR